MSFLNRQTKTRAKLTEEAIFYSCMVDAHFARPPDAEVKIEQK